MVGSFLGGGPLAKPARKCAAPWKWAKAEKLGKRIWGLGKKLLDDFDGWRKSRKEASRLSKIAESCEKPNSFTADTKALMADGTTRAIKDVRIGDEVLATDPETEKTKPEKVTAEIKGVGLKHLVQVTVDVDGKQGTKTASVTATDQHSFWVPELGEWLDATNLH